MPEWPKGMIMYKWMQIADSRMGEKEIKGDEDNLSIVQYFADVGHGWVKDDETAWCAAFVGSCLENAGFTSTKALNARSYLKWGRKIDVPVKGCIVVFKRGNSAWKGHVAFFMGIEGNYIKVLGGNQSNMVKVSTYHKDDLLGYRMPKTKMTSKTNWAAGAGSVGVIASQAESIGKAIDKISAVTQKSGDLAEKVGGVVDAGFVPFLAIIAVVGVFIFIMRERNKKVDQHGI